MEGVNVWANADGYDLGLMYGLMLMGIELGLMYGLMLMGMS